MTKRIGTVMTVALTGFFSLTVAAAEQYALVRSYKVDGKEVRLADGYKWLDLTKIYPYGWCAGADGTRWANVEMTLECESEKTVRLYYNNEWFGELFVNGACIRTDMNGPGEGMAHVEVPFRKGANSVVLRTRAGHLGWHCALGFNGEKRPGKADATVDFAKDGGRIRPRLYSSGFGLLICSCPKKTVDDIRSMNFAAARTHDWALINPNELVCDYFHVFPLMHLDATKEENYHFGPTDYLLKRTREETGLDVFYHLGTSIKHSGDKVHFNSLISEYFEKVAEIFTATFRHYNRGWANGFDWGIRNWEIWNEPDGRNNMWCLPDGDEDADPKARAEKTSRRRALFVWFFVTYLKRLKTKFSDIKVGGPAMCSLNEEWFVPHLTACREAGVAPDFISWHYYGSNPDEIFRSVERGRRLCDRFGFKDGELVLDEWHYLGSSWAELRSSDPVVQDRVWNGPASHNGTDAAAFTLSVLARFQTSALNQGYYYGCRHVGAWGYKDERNHPYKTYYALKAFGEIVKDFPRQGEVKKTGPADDVGRTFGQR